jgi:hypothetical protein
LSADDNYADLIPGADVPSRGGRRGPQARRRRGARGEDVPASGQAPATQRPPRAQHALRSPGRDENRDDVVGTGEVPIEEDQAVGPQVLEPAEALARYLETGAGAKAASTSFHLPADRAVALQLMRQELRMQGFTAREASMSNIVSAMIDQWYERIFGRPIGG